MGFMNQRFRVPGFRFLQPTTWTIDDGRWTIIRPSARIHPAAQHVRNGLRDRHRVAIAVRQQLQFRHGALADGVGDGVLHRFVNEGLVAEPYFSLRRVNVDVDAVGRNLEKEVDLRAAFLDRRVAVGLDNRMGDRLILDDAPVHEDILRPARRSLLCQRRDEPLMLKPESAFPTGTRSGRSPNT